MPADMPVQTISSHRAGHIAGCGSYSRTPSMIDARRVDSLDNEQLGGSAHGLAAVPQDRNRAIVVPIVNDMLEKISIAAARHLHKDVAAHRFAAVGKTDLVQSRVRPLDDLWEIEQSS